MWTRLQGIGNALLCLPILLLGCQDSSSGRPDGDFIVASAVAQDFDPAKLASAEKQADALAYVQSLLILRNGEIVSEHYYDGCDRSTAFNIKSVSKGFLSALVGIALREGHIGSLDQTVFDFFPEYFPESNNPKKRQITIRHLLTMTAGLRWIENGPLTTSWVASDNWIKFFIDLPVLESPGESFIYNTAGTHTLSAILTKATGMSTLAYAEQHLFVPARIAVRRWDRDPQGYYWGGSEMYFTARDMARLGVLYLNDGALNGQQIVPVAWVQESIRHQVHLQATGYTTFFLDRGVDSYGYLWWRKQFDHHDVFFAWGYGGQFIFVVPDLRVVVVLTSSLLSAASETSWLNHEQAVFSLLANDIIPAVVNR